MYTDTLEHFAATARKKAGLIHRSPLAFLIGAAMAGAYVGLGIILIFTLGAQVPADIRALVMGLAFGIALTLVVFAGSELFTGHTLYMTIGRLRKTVSGADLIKAWSMSWSGNLVGATALALLYVAGNGYLLNGGGELLFEVAAKKMNAPAIELFARAVLCNWLVCLALWMAARLSSETAKAIAIFWCLFAFIASGYEHSVANMTVFALALLSPGHPEALTLAGMTHNLTWVTLGNAVAGSVVMALGYHLASPNPEPVNQHS